MKELQYEKIKIAVFCLTLGILCLASVLHKPKKFSEEENRYLAEMPEITTKSLLDGSFMKDYETYIVDQFPERSFFTGVKTLVERIRGRKDDNEVYFGKSGYLFGKYDTALFESELAKKNVATLIEFAENRKKDFGRGHFQIAMIPSSAEILKENLPSLAPVYDETEFVKNLGKSLGEEVVLQTPQLLRTYRKEYIYYRTDHHWTSLGAYYVYKELAKRFGLSPRELTSYQKEEIEGEFLGTYDSKVSTKISGGVIPDKITLYSTENEKNATMIWDGKEKFQGIFHREALKGKDKYSVFVGGNHGTTDIQTDGKEGRSLLVLKDSFAHSLVPFFMEDYNRIVMLDLRHFNKSLKKYMEENSFTDVLVLYSTADFVVDNNIAKLLR